MEKTVYQVRMTTALSDFRSQLSPAGILVLFENASLMDLRRQGWDKAAFDARGFTWVLAGLSFAVEGPLPRVGDEVACHTWCRRRDRMVLWRDFAIWVNGVRVIQATVAWLVISIDEHKPLPSKSIGENSLGCLGGDTPLPVERLRFRDVPFSDVPTHTVCAQFSDLDLNGHVNNVRYMTWCVDAVALGKKALGKVRAVRINWLTEVIMGETVALFCHEDADGWVNVEGRKSDGKACVRARLRFDPATAEDVFRSCDKLPEQV